MPPQRRQAQSRWSWRRRRRWHALTLLALALLAAAARAAADEAPCGPFGALRADVEGVRAALLSGAVTCGDVVERHLQRIRACVTLAR